jgi:branched-chain amino acid transport system permease protein
MNLMTIPTPLLIEQVLNGVILGSMYAMIACGLTLIWGTMRMLNFAHGEMYMAGGYFFFVASSITGMPLAAAALLAIILTFALGFVLERSVIHPLLKKDNWEFSTIVVTLGLSVILQNGALLIWRERVRQVPYFIDGVTNLWGVRLSNQRLLIFVVAVVTVGLMWALLKKSRFGLALRATSLDRDAATIYGVNVNRIYSLTFGMAAALAALAAVFLSSINSVNPWMGAPVMLKGFAVVVLGGLGSFQGAIIGGLLIGTIETLGVLFWSSQWREVISFSILIGVLWLRPWGLFGLKEEH